MFNPGDQFPGIFYCLDLLSPEEVILCRTKWHCLR